MLLVPLFVGPAALPFRLLCSTKTEKVHQKRKNICICQKKVVPLHAEKIELFYILKTNTELREYYADSNRI